MSVFNCNEKEEIIVESDSDPLSRTLLSLAKPREHTMKTRSQGPAGPI